MPKKERFSMQIQLTQWRRDASCSWCSRNGGCPVADFGAGFVRDVVLCWRCLKRATEARVQLARDGYGPPHENGRATTACAAMTVYLRFPRPFPFPLSAMQRLHHKPQEIPLDHADSTNFFAPTENKPFVATPAAIEEHGIETIVACLQVLQGKAAEHDGLDYLQVFESQDDVENLWFIEDGPGGAITALLPSDY